MDLSGPMVGVPVVSLSNQTRLAILGNNDMLPGVRKSNPQKQPADNVTPQPNPNTVVDALKSRKTSYITTSNQTHGIALLCLLLISSASKRLPQNSHRTSLPASFLFFFAGLVPVAGSHDRLKAQGSLRGPTVQNGVLDVHTPGVGTIWLKDSPTFFS